MQDTPAHAPVLNRKRSTRASSQARHAAPTQPMPPDASRQTSGHDAQSPHPGEILRENVIEALGLSVTEAASRLAMSRVALSRVLNGKAGISPDLAVRLEQAGASTARAWLAMQANYDLWQAQQHEQPPVRSLAATD